MRLINILLVLLLVLLYVYKLGLVRSNEFEVETKEQIHTNLQISSNTMGGGLNLYSEEKEGMLLYYLVYIPEENACEYCEITCQNGKTESKKIVKYSSVEYRVVVDENREYIDKIVVKSYSSTGKIICMSDMYVYWDVIQKRLYLSCF